MKELIIFIFTLFIAAGANAFQSDYFQNKPDAKPDSVTIAPGDSTEYELIVLDVGFNSWFISNRKPIWYYDKEYYHIKNTFFTTTWNIRVLDNMHREPYDFEIDFDQKIDYGLDVEWQLFWYYKYLEQKYHINLGP
jgi:hypothetical protein